MGPGGHLRGMDVLVVRHSADWALPEQHTGSWERTATERVELPLHVMDCSERMAVPDVKSVSWADDNSFGSRFHLGVGVGCEYRSEGYSEYPY